MSSDTQRDTGAQINPPVESPLTDKPGAAGYLGKVCTRTVDNYMRDGTLPFVKLGRRVLFRKSDLDALIASRVQRRGTA